MPIKITTSNRSRSNRAPSAWQRLGGKGARPRARHKGKVRNTVARS